MIDLFGKVKVYFEKGIWEDPEKASYWKSAGLRVLRILLISFKGFTVNKNGLKASALTFYAVLSIVPVLAVAFGVAQGFGFEDALEQQVRETFAGQEEVMNKIIEFSRKSLNNVSGGLVAGISLLFLLWSVIKLLNHIEIALNAIWNIKKSRSFIRKFTDYLVLILLGPFFIILSSSATVFINTFLQDMSQGSAIIEITSGFFLYLMKLAPFVLLWILFTLLYIIIPNKNVKFAPALIAGIIAGSAFEFLQSGYVYFQMAMSRYNTIYGSFAALPLFLIWMQISWLIILMGAEISHAVQYSDRLIHAAESKLISSRLTKLLGLNTLKKIVEKFNKGDMAPTANDLAEELNLPINYIERALFVLERGGLISVIQGKGNKTTFQPATASENLRLSVVLQKIDAVGLNELRVKKTNDFTQLEEKLAAMAQRLEGGELDRPIGML